MTCESCNNHAMELFPGKLEGEREIKQLCLGCVPKCEYVGPSTLHNGLLRRPECCTEPRDHRSYFFCTAHEIAVCRWSLERCDDPEDAAEYRQTIAELEGAGEMRIAA